MTRHDDRSSRPIGKAHVRRIATGEADLLRAVRLRALADAPLAFGSNHAREVAFPPDTWRNRARNGAASDRQATFFAVAPGATTPVGVATCVRDADEPDRAHLYGMWVAAEARGMGAGAALVEAVAAWARHAGARLVRTSVTVGNDGAARLYARAGFRDTGTREPLGHSGAEVAVLERALEPR